MAKYPTPLFRIATNHTVDGTWGDARRFGALDLRIDFRVLQKQLQLWLQHFSRCSRRQNAADNEHGVLSEPTGREYPVRVLSSFLRSGTTQRRIKALVRLPIIAKRTRFTQRLPFERAWSGIVGESIVDRLHCFGHGSQLPVPIQGK